MVSEIEALLKKYNIPAGIPFNVFHGTNFVGKFRVTDDNFEMENFSMWEDAPFSVLIKIFNGVYHTDNPVKTPKIGEIYYVPFVGICKWEGDNKDYDWFRQGVIFKTMAQALEAEYKMVEYMKEGKKDGK